MDSQRDLIKKFLEQAYESHGPFYVQTLQDTLYQLKNDSDRIRFCYNLLKEANVLPTKIDVVCAKDESKALRIRNTGNKFFASKEYTKALKFYNESLCFAPAGSESLSIGYANRSAIYLDTGFFQFCLDNIDLALENGYPERLKAKLLKRKETCMERMKTEEDSFKLYGTPEDLKLSYPANPKIPFIVDALYCKTSETRGRGIYTKRDLKPGDVIIIEEPFQAKLNSTHVYSYCNRCCSKNFLNLKPCAKSTSAMFCSDKCGQDAWKRYHKYEYPVLHGLSKFMPICSEHPSVRATLKALTMVDNLTDLRELIDSIDLETENAFDIDFTTEDERSKFRAFYALRTHPYTDIKKSLVFASCNVAIVWHIFKEFSALPELLATESDQDLFLNLLFKFVDICHINGHILEFDTSDKLYGAGVSLLFSLLNHSCAPNVVRVSHLSKLVVCVIRPIKRGEELFDDYGINFIEKTLEERQHHLKKKYQFECKCAACQNDYPLVDDLPLKLQYSPDQLALLARIMDKNYCNTVESRSMYMRDKELICRILNDEDHKYPSGEIVMLTATWEKIMNHLSRTKTLEEIFSGYSAKKEALKRLF